MTHYRRANAVNWLALIVVIILFTGPLVLLGILAHLQ